MEYIGWLKPDFENELDRLYKLIGEQKGKMQRLHELNCEQAEEIERLRGEVERLKAGVRLKNERNAGRKTMLTQELSSKIKEYRASGMTYRAIAEKMGFSIGFVHKAMKKSESDG